MMKKSATPIWAASKPERLNRKSIGSGFYNVQSMAVAKRNRNNQSLPTEILSLKDS
jgi:hypothetical protein